MRIRVPYHHQKNCYFCGPTVLKMVMETMGAKKTENEIARVAGTTAEKGTSHQGMIDAARKNGFQCFVHENTPIKTVSAFLKASLPVIIDWTDNKSRMGHYSIMREIAGGKVHLCDPWYGPEHSIGIKLFMEYWKDSLTRGKQWTMVLLPPGAKVRQETEIKSGKEKIIVQSGRIYYPKAVNLG